MEEEWKDIKGYEGKYQVSNFGNVRSLNYNKTGKTKLLNPEKGKHGYLYVRLYKNGKASGKLVHRLVAEAFLPNPLNLPIINHKDEDKTNNVCCLPTNCNLEWCDYRYNINYGTANQRRAVSISKPINQFDKNGNFIRQWKSATEAGQNLGIKNTSIGNCLKGTAKTSGGFIWRFVS